MEDDVAGTGVIQNSCYNTGNYILDDDENELRVTFLKICAHNAQTFRIDNKDISDVSFEQVIQKLDNPDLIIKGERIFYKFSTQVGVFER